MNNITFNQRFIGLIGLCFEMRNVSYVCREAEHRQKKIIVLHAVIKMVEPAHRGRLTGEGLKPPKGAVVKSYGIERLG